MSDPFENSRNESSRNGAGRRTPEASLKEVFLLASRDFPEERERSSVVAEALDFLQRGFEAHYAGGSAADEEVLVGDYSYAQAVETIARLDEPRFVEVASRMIRDGAGLIARGEAVSLESWTPHLGELLAVVSGEGNGPSERRIRAARRSVPG